jgi:hypothetical protein
MENITSDLTDEEKHFLTQESLVTEALKRRKLDSERPKPVWQRFLESPGGAAILTAVLVGTFTQFTTIMSQREATNREIILLTEKDYIEQQRELVTRAYELIGSSIASSQDVMSLATAEFDVNTVSGKDKDALSKQISSILNRFNTAREQWNTEKGKLRLLLTYYNPNNPEVPAAWTATEDSVSEYSTCTSQFVERYEGRSRFNEAEKPCEKQKQVVWRTLEELNNVLTRSRRYIQNH